MSILRRQYWLWVTRQEFFQNLKVGFDPKDWWTCSKDTKEGDLIFLWRTRPRSDIGLLLRAESDAAPQLDVAVPTEGWKYCCKYRVLCEFDNPITIADLKNHPRLADWGALRSGFRRASFRVDPSDWMRLCKLAIKKNQGFEKVLNRAERSASRRKITLEEHIEDALQKNPGLLRKIGFDAKFEQRQVVCQEANGRIDMLFWEKKKKAWLVVELKNVRADSDTFGQISRYVGWVKKYLAKRTSVIGLVISRGADNSFTMATETNKMIRQCDLADLGLN
ncbi:MAG: EVE domain-containing protein [Rhodospirillales bacterium]|nr:EVE domain-containing protein [Rhodospirillales bacterium]